MTADRSDDPARARRASPWLSWDRLGFRLLVFGSLALFWVLAGRLAGRPWSVMVLAEFGGLLPWAFLARIVLERSRRARVEQVGWWRFARVHLAGMVLAFVPWWLIQRAIEAAWTAATDGWGPSSVAALRPTVANLLGGFLYVPFVYFLILLGAEAMREAEARTEEELRAGQLARQLAEARLAALQQQLHPHFLFNALQAISTLLHRDPPLADALLVKLSALLRGVLDDASERTITLRRELELTKNYLDIEQVRFHDRLHVEWSIAAEALECRVPGLVLLPLVENAIRHGLSRKVGPCRLDVRADVIDGALVMTVSDDGLGAAGAIRPGVGLGNTAERLRALYGDGAQLAYGNAPEGGFRTTIRLPRERVT